MSSRKLPALMGIAAFKNFAISKQSRPLDRTVVNDKISIQIPGYEAPDLNAWCSAPSRKMVHPTLRHVHVIRCWKPTFPSWLTPWRHGWCPHICHVYGRSTKAYLYSNGQFPCNCKYHIPSYDYMHAQRVHHDFCIRIIIMDPLEKHVKRVPCTLLQHHKYILGRMYWRPSDQEPGTVQCLN